MHRLTMMAGALCAALMMSTGAFAQVPPNPNNPNDTVPDVLPFTPPYGEPINLETAKKVAAGQLPRRKSAIGMRIVSRSSVRPAISCIFRRTTIADMRQFPLRSIKHASPLGIGAPRSYSKPLLARAPTSLI
jgi:hypothetical protein